MERHLHNECITSEDNLNKNQNGEQTPAAHHFISTCELQGFKALWFLMNPNRSFEI